MRVFFDLCRLEFVTEKEMAAEYAADKTYTETFAQYLEDGSFEMGGDLKEITSETLTALRAQLSNLH